MISIGKQAIAIVMIGVSIVLASCEQRVAVGTVVHEDGSLDRSITLQESDSSGSSRNMFGLEEANGWKKTVAKSKKQEEKKSQYDITFEKHFANADEINKELNKPTDTLFSIRSEFKKSFRWFYTYVHYSDTYIAINKFTNTKPENFFTDEDFQFIDRLPGEGKPISMADSLYLVRLSEKIYDIYAARAFFDDYYDNLINVVKESEMEQRWADTLKVHKNALFNKLMQENDSDFDDNFILAFADSLHIPVGEQERARYGAVMGPVKKKIDFMSSAAETKYHHSISMPWDVIETNADSTAQNQLYWNPPVTKFLLRDYTMRATARKLNWWTVAVSVGFLIATLYVWLRRSTGAAS